MSRYDEYKAHVCAKINNCLETMECQPILFIGSGFSKRYFNAPSWQELLQLLAKNNPEAKEYAYYKQNCRDFIDIGSKLAQVYAEWAWGKGRNSFPEDLFTDIWGSDIYIKQFISEYMKHITPKSTADVNEIYKHEIELIQKIRPHAIITTNYDGFIELLFPEYEPIIGQKILRSQFASIGEIFKIHGCVSDVQSLVFTREDYDNFISKKKYLSAKLLTYFLEHPIFVIGYSINDPNIRSILSDIDEILVSNNELVPNLFIIDWIPEINENSKYSDEVLLRLENGKSIRINSITTNSFEWILQSLINDNALEKVNLKLLRALLSRTYELVRTDIPKRSIDVDYDTLEHALANREDICKIFGITTLSNPNAFNIQYPYTLSIVAEKLGYNYWSYADDLIKRVKDEKGYDIKSCDNLYHIAIKTGCKSVSRKYSDELVLLLQGVKENKPYEIKE